MRARVRPGLWRPWCLSWCLSRCLSRCLSWLLALPWCVPAGAAAQSLQDAVQQHVDEGIERSQKNAAEGDKPKKKPKKRKSKKKPKKEREGARPDGGDADLSFSIGDGVQPEAPGKAAPKLPHRLFPDYLRLDLKVGGGYRGWVPQQYERVAVDVGHYFTWNVSARAKLMKLLVLHEGYYETNALSAPRNEEAAVLAAAGGHVPKAAWLLGTFGLPFLKVWEPIIQYESRAFRTRAKPSQPVCLVPRDNPPTDLSTCPRTMDDLEIISGFETLVVGVRYNHDKDPDAVIREQKGKVPPILVGVGLMSYEKPYQLVIDGATLDDLLFDAKFRGAGLAFGTKLGGGVNRFVFDLRVQAGLGEVSLTDGLSLNEVIPSDWVVGYVQGNLTAAINIPLWKFAPTLMLQPSGSFGGATFYLIDTDIEEDEQAATPNVNWDVLWAAQASLVLSI